MYNQINWHIKIGVEFEKGSCFWLKNGDIQFLAEHLCHFQGEKAKKRPGRTTTYNSNLGVIIQSEIRIHGHLQSIIGLMTIKGINCKNLDLNRSYKKKH